MGGRVKNILALFFLLAVTSHAQTYPSWWENRIVTHPHRAADDYHIVNQGQVKWIVTRAYEEFELKLPGNTNIWAMIEAFPAEGNQRPANLGMLKNAAQPFYDRLIAEGYVTNYPWYGLPSDEYRIANQGQLKNLFSFDLDTYDLDENGVPDWYDAQYGHLYTNTAALLSAYDDWQANHVVDSSGDGMPDAWKLYHGLDPLDSGDAHEDLDEDGLTNLEEFQIGTQPDNPDTDRDGKTDGWKVANGYDPLTPSWLASGYPGELLVDVWTNVTGKFLSHLYAKPAWPDEPDYSHYISQTEYIGLGHHYGRRWRGTLTPATSGLYQFRMSADESALFMLSPNQWPFRAESLAYVHRWTLQDEYDRYTGQVSRWIPLEADTPYYMEVQHKQDGGADHVRLQWRMEGDDWSTISSNHFHSFVETPPEIEDDSKPETWDVYETADPLDPNVPYHEPQGHALTNILHAIGLPLEPVPPLIPIVQASVLDAEWCDNWTEQNGEALALTGRGSLRWTIELPESGVFLAELEGYIDDHALPFAAQGWFKLDGEILHFAPWQLDGESPFRWLMPWLPAGIYTLEFGWYRRPFIGWPTVRGLTVHDIAGPDTTGSGRPDWEEAWLSARNGVQPISYSVTSPANLQGWARFGRRVLVNDEPALDAGAWRWHADIALSADTPTLVEAVFEYGALVQTNSILWTALDTLTGEDIVMRMGDTLRMGVHPEPGGTLEIIITPGEDGASLTDEDVYDWTPQEAGSYGVVSVFTASNQAVVAATTTIHVVESTLPDGAMVVWREKPLEWFLPSWDEWAVPDPDTGLLVEMADSAWGGKRLSVRGLDLGIRALSARLGEDGPFMDTRDIVVTRVMSAGGTYNVFKDTLSDGSKISETAVIAPFLPEGAEIRMQIFTAGITFMDGTTVKYITAEDLDSFVHIVQFLHAPTQDGSFCHRLYLHFDGRLIGMRGYQ